MEVRLLGPVEVEVGGAPVALGGPRERALLARLALSPGAVVAEAALVDGIWGDDPPRTVGKVVQNVVLRLRKALRAAGETDAIETAPGGYRLAATAADVDASRVEVLWARVRAAAADDDHATVATACAEALAAWRGDDVIGGVGDAPFAAAERTRLHELRLTLVEHRVDAELALGRHAVLVAELEALCRAQPLRERLWGQLMLSLHRCGRQADALRAFQSARRVLGDELGLDPGPRLVDLERAIARHDPALDLRSGSLPSGIVTFLMTDVEGSTAILERAGDDYRRAIEEHNALLREVWRAHGGVEVATLGDGFLVAFADAAEALRSGVDAQRRLRSHAWPEGAELRVRVGAHTGEAEPTGHDYIALAVHQVARVTSSARGGQFVVSDDALAAAGGPTALRGACACSDLGPHRVRDFPAAVRLHQLDDPAHVTSFPPLRTLDAREHDLPRYRTSFVGRVEDRAEVAELLRRTGMVTVVGPGGVGKTRLAVEVAHRMLDECADGVHLAELAAVDDPALVPHVVAQALKVTDESGGGSPTEAIVTALRDREVLVVLDNCEHVVDAAAALAEAIGARCPRTAILATSREPLRVDGEAIWRLPPLRPPLADEVAVDELLTSDAVRLFVERAQLVRPRFTLTSATAKSVARVVTDLDGIPLALELAAAALEQLPLDELAARLDDRFELLTGGRRTAPARHQTLHAVIGWSYDLLSDADRWLLDALAVFAGTFTASAAAAVVGAAGDGVDVASGIARLVARSLLVSHEDTADGALRVSMLESVRAFAAAQLEARGVAGGVRDAHLEWCRTQAGAARPYLDVADAPEWLAVLDREHDNLRAALGWALSSGRAVDALALVVDLTPFWDVRGHRVEGCRWLERALDAAAGIPDVPASLRARAMGELGGMVMNVDIAAGLAHARAGYELALDAGDEAAAANVALSLGLILHDTGDLDGAREVLTRARTWFEGCGDRAHTAVAIERLSDILRAQGDHEGFRSMVQEAIDLQRAVGDRRGLFWSMAAEAVRLLAELDADGSAAHIAEARAIADELGYADGDAWMACAEAQWALATGDVDTAASRFAHALGVHRAIGDQMVIGWSLAGTARVALHRGDLAAAKAATVECLSLRETSPTPWTWWHVCVHAASIAFAGGAFDLAARALAAADAYHPRMHRLPSGQDVVDADWTRAAVVAAVGVDRYAALVDAAAPLDDPETAPLAEFAAWEPPPAVVTDVPPLWRVR